MTVAALISDSGTAALMDGGAARICGLVAGDDKCKCCPTPTCTQCGSCCYSSDCHVTFAWSLKDTPFAPGDESSNVGLTGSDYAGAIAAINSVLTGSVSMPIGLGGGGTLGWGIDTFSSYDPATGLCTGNALFAEKLCATTGEWAFDNFNSHGGLLWSSIPPSKFFVSLQAYSAVPFSGKTGCCGIPASTPIVVTLIVFDGSTGNYLVYYTWTIKASITVTGNKCCFNGTNCEYTGSENCSSSFSSGQCPPGF